MNEISNLPPIDFGIVEDRTMKILGRRCGWCRMQCRQEYV